MSARGALGEDSIAHFCSITGASVREARKYLERHRRLDAAIDAFYNSSNSAAKPVPSTSKLTALFDKYKDSDGPDITIDGTIKLCEDLNVNPEDVVLLAVAYELKSPSVGVWKRQGWIQGWKSVGWMQTALGNLREKLGSDPGYFQKVYNYTFEFARVEGQRSLALDSAQAFWNLLLPHGLKGGGLTHSPAKSNNAEALESTEEGGWKEEYTELWYEFLNQRKGKGVSKDTWAMFLEFVRSIDAKFSNYDMDAAWPSTIDDFVEYARQRLAS
ncbi:hypothetical protein AMATHDRAFT_145703 [Amanita thiersii Skay4041]|uniref:Defective in cullin neddylation protein n=1 Tax=Amanita thiersii Skay4041 TaxID=703135 RepID=A0A2A9NLK6_9AGAR|nr:hypothetical protein AMATHDRAFT_145703 [Amanita thiersii Skay4041]